MTEKVDLETDPTGRFQRLKELLGSGAFKSVYKAIDLHRGIEVAWNQLRLSQFHSEDDFKKLYAEIQILGQLKHQNIIEFYGSWIDETKHEVVFITECMTSGTLKQFIKKARNLKISVIKNWCIQILKGLNYLHTRSPPVIHRDIKCDNIFINGSLGEVKIGDLGLATVRKSNNALSIIGTPEFMAPEYYEEHYTEKVDIWAFGLCVLEMVTHDYPYSECSNPAQIFKRVSTGNLPAGLNRVKDDQVKAFIRLCLAPEKSRPSAAELLHHPFLTTPEEEDKQLLAVADVKEPNGAPSLPSSMNSPLDPQHSERQYTIAFGEDEGGPVVKDIQIIGVDTNQYEDKIILKLMLMIEDNLREIEFPFDLKVDTATTVATEMVQELQLPKACLATISTLMQNHVDEAVRQRQERKKAIQDSTSSAPVSLITPGEAVSPTFSTTSTANVSASLPTPIQNRPVPVSVAANGVTSRTNSSELLPVAAAQPKAQPAQPTPQQPIHSLTQPIQPVPISTQPLQPIPVQQHQQTMPFSNINGTRQTPSPKGSPTSQRKEFISDSGSALYKDLRDILEQTQEKIQEDEDEEFMNQMYQALLLKHQKERDSLQQKQAEELRRFEVVRETKRQQARTRTPPVPVQMPVQAQVQVPVAVPNQHVYAAPVTGYQPAPLHPQQQPQQIKPLQPTPHPQPATVQQIPTQSTPYTIPAQPPSQSTTSQQAGLSLHQIDKSSLGRVVNSNPNIPYQSPVVAQAAGVFFPQSHSASNLVSMTALGAHASPTTVPTPPSSNPLTNKEKKDKDQASRLSEMLAIKSLEAFTNSGFKLGEMVSSQLLKENATASAPVTSNAPLSYLNAVLAPSNSVALSGKSPTPPSSNTLLNSQIPFHTAAAPKSVPATNAIPIPMSMNTNLASALSPPPSHGRDTQTLPMFSSSVPSSAPASPPNALSELLGVPFNTTGVQKLGTNTGAKTPNGLQLVDEFFSLEPSPMSSVAHTPYQALSPPSSTGLTSTQAAILIGGNSSDNPPVIFEM